MASRLTEKVCAARGHFRVADRDVQASGFRKNYAFARIHSFDTSARAIDTERGGRGTPGQILSGDNPSPQDAHPSGM
jgi:hypothetical protein